MCEDRDGLRVRAWITFPSASREVLIFSPSLRVTPLAPDLPTLSEPARSHSVSRALVTACVVAALRSVRARVSTLQRERSVGLEGSCGSSSPLSLVASISLSSLLLAVGASDCWSLIVSFKSEAEEVA